MEILLNEKVLFPFLATLGASLSVILIQFLSRYIKEQKQKIFTLNYMLDVAYRILFSSLVIKVHTIKPHIEATSQILKGDIELLTKTFESDEFDILKAQPHKFMDLPEEYKFIVGYENLLLIQMLDALKYLFEMEQNRLHLNEFVKNNLKSPLNFLKLDQHKQIDILSTYLDILVSLEHEQNRIISFINDSFVPTLIIYKKQKQFWLFKTKTAKQRIETIEEVLKEYKSSLPEKGYMDKVKNGGIQKELK